MDFYHNLITEKSWKLLIKLRKNYDFILIGGWAVFLYTKALKSKDIDLVVDYEELSKLKKEFDVFKNDRLKKYEARSAEVEIDIYVPFYSNPGLPAEDLRNFSLSIEGFKTVEKEILAILKQRALMDRIHSVKGRKDLIDLISLISSEDFYWDRYRKTLKGYGLQEYLRFAKEEIAKVREINEIGLNVHKMARLKKKILPLFENEAS